MTRPSWNVKCSGCGRVFVTKVSRERKCPHCGAFGWHKHSVLVNRRAR